MADICSKFRAVHLEMIRCAGTLDLYNAFRKPNLRHYMLFDYFDVMLVQEEDPEHLLQYEDCIAQLKLADQIDLKTHAKITARNYCTLVRPSSLEYPNDIFSGGQFNQTNYTDAPFLAVIMLTFLPDYIDTVKQNKPHQIIPFLTSCIDKIDNKVKGIIENSPINKVSDIQSACFATLDMGHFAIIVRSKDPYLPNKIARELNRPDIFSDTASTNSPDYAGSKNTTPPMLFQTYTTQGMEMGLYWREENEQLIVEKKKGTIKTTQSNWGEKCLVILRSANEEIAKYIKDKSNANFIHWLSGRYHYTQRVSFNTYFCFYSDLCYYKFGSGEPGQSLKLDAFPKFTNASAVINERLMLQCSKQEPEGDPQKPKMNIPDYNPEHLLKVLEKKLDQLLLRQDLLPYGQNVFYENWRLFHEVIAICASIFKFTDSYYNGMTLYMMIYIALDAVDMYLCKLRSLSDPSLMSQQGQLMENRNNICDYLLKSCSTFLDEIMSFLKTIQTLSLQTLQSPHYGIQPGIDGEKYLMAALEFARRYSILTIKINPGSHETAQSPYGKLSFPYLCIDHHYEEMTSSLRFPPLETDFCGRDALPVLLKTSVPNFQYFARIYDILPLTIHEISHHIRFIEREKRNQFFSDFLFERVSFIITKIWFQKSNIGCVPEYLPNFRQIVLKGLSDALQMAYVDYNESISEQNNTDNPSSNIWNTFDMNDLMENLNSFLRTCVFYNPTKDNNYILLEQLKSNDNALVLCITQFHQYIAGYQGNPRYDRFLRHINQLEKQASKNDLYPVIEMIKDPIQDDIVIIMSEELHMAFMLYPAAQYNCKDSKYHIREFVCFLNHEIHNFPEIFSEDRQNDEAKDNFIPPTKNEIFDLSQELALSLTSEQCKQSLFYLETIFNNAWDTILQRIPDNQQLIMLAHQAKAEINNCLKRIYDLRLLLDNFRLIDQTSIPISEDETPREDPHNAFFKYATANLRQIIQNEIAIHPESLRTYLLFDSKQISRSQILASNAIILETSLIESVKAIEDAEKEEVIESARHAYEEVCADLCMCAILSLNSLGCLYLYAKHENRINDSILIYPNDNISYERFNYVIATLLLMEGENKHKTELTKIEKDGFYYACASGLINSLKKNIDKTADSIIKVLSKSFPAKSPLTAALKRAFYGPCCQLEATLDTLDKKMEKRPLSNLSSSIQELASNIITRLKDCLARMNISDIPDTAFQLLYELEAIYNPIEPSKAQIEGFANNLGSSFKAKENLHLVNNIFNQWRYLLICINYIMASTVESPYCFSQNGISITSSVKPAFRIPVDHFKFYRKMFDKINNCNKDILLGEVSLTKSEREPQKASQQLNLCKEIGQYYNNYDIVIQPDKKRKMLDWTFEYILTYYYCHIFTMPNLLNGDHPEINEEALYTKILHYLGDDPH